MSEKGNTAASAPGFQTTGSPIRDDRGSVSGTAQAAPPGGHGPGHQDYGAVQHAHGGDQRPQQVPTRLLGVHNILNPLEPRVEATEGGPLHPSRTREQADVSQPPSPAQHGPAHPFYPLQHGAGPHHGPPLTSVAPLPGPPPSSGRTSPTNYPPNAVQSQRRILSPRGPRPTNISHGGPSGDPDPRLPPRLASASPAKRPYEPEPGEDYMGHPMAGRHPSSVPHTPNLPKESVSRPFSQPMAQLPGGPHAPPVSLPPREYQARTSVSPAQMAIQPPGTQGNRSFSMSSAPGPSGEQIPPPWSESMRRASLGAPIMGGETRQAFMTLPGSDSPIEVPVDTTQASKKASEKRQRNANASTRHRAKRRLLQEENARQLQDLKEEREEMELRIEELEAQRDHYRNERNRLRDIVRATPSVSDLAAGPPSPTLTRLSEAGPMGRPRHGPTPIREYSSEASSAERPAQRPRLDERSGYETPSAGASGAQTPMQGPGYGPPSRPTSASSSTGAVERLPPLRSIERPPPGHGPPQEQDPRTGQWVPIQPRQYETGWATGPRKPGDGPSR
jgi:hypothetical protein